MKVTWKVDENGTASLFTDWSHADGILTLQFTAGDPTYSFTYSDPWYPIWHPVSIFLARACNILREWIRTKADPEELDVAFVVMAILVPVALGFWV